MVKLEPRVYQKKDVLEEILEEFLERISPRNFKDKKRFPLIPFSVSIFHCKRLSKCFS